MITKNAKCASMYPPERITSPALDAERPALTNSEPAVRFPPGEPAPKGRDRRDQGDPDRERPPVAHREPEDRERRAQRGEHPEQEPVAALPLLVADQIAVREIVEHTAHRRITPSSASFGSRTGTT